MTTELRCDFDGPFPEDALFRLGVITRHHAWPVDRVMIRRTRHGWHLIATVDADLSPVAVVAVQAMMGSDWKRETFNLLRAERLQDVPATWREARRWNALYTSHTHC